jgi:hypothetical protein
MQWIIPFFHVMEFKGKCIPYWSRPAVSPLNWRLVAYLPINMFRIELFLYFERPATPRQEIIGNKKIHLSGKNATLQLIEKQSFNLSAILRRSMVFAIRIRRSINE